MATAKTGSKRSGGALYKDQASAIDRLVAQNNAYKVAEAERGRAMQSCAFNLTIGRHHWNYKGGPYQVCVTPTQAERLFKAMGKAPRKIGCGTFACAYDSKHPDRVVKITRDKDDVAAMQKAQGLRNVPKLYDAFELKSPARWKSYRLPDGSPMPPQPKVYAMVVERARPLRGGEKTMWSRRLWCLSQALDRRGGRAKLWDQSGDTAPTTARHNAPTAKKPVPLVRQPLPKLGRLPDATAICCPKKGAENRACVYGMRNLIRGIAELQTQRDIKWTDMHAGNIGVGRDGNWKIFDLGITHVPFDRDPEALFGRARVRAKAQKRRRAR